MPRKRLPMVDAGSPAPTVAFKDVAGVRISFISACQCGDFLATVTTSDTRARLVCDGCKAVRADLSATAIEKLAGATALVKGLTGRLPDIEIHPPTMLRRDEDGTITRTGREPEKESDDPW